MAEPSATCVQCGGEGWVVDHSDACYAEGSCVGTGCPVQRVCECVMRDVSPTPYDPDQEPF